nr:MAG TPA: hypothetical protein [Caudoviricetes sp.]
MAQNYTEQLRKDNVRDAIYEDLQNNCEVLRTSWSGNAFPANPKVGQPCYRVDEDKLYYWDGYKWSQKGGGGSAELKTMELAAATSERVSITLEGARCLDKNMMFVFVDKIAQDPSTYSMNDDGTVVNFNPTIPANAAVTLRWFDTDVGTFDTAIFASDAEFAAGELTNRAPNVRQVHSLSDMVASKLSGLELMDVVLAPLGIDESKNKRRYLNGQVLIQSQFPAFTAAVKARMTAMANAFTTEVNWQAEKTQSKLGQCGKFVVDDTAGTIRLPCVVNAQGLVDLALIGGIKSESLPNIKGTVGGTNRTDTCETTNGFKDFTGAFYNSGDVTDKVCATAVAATYPTNGLGFNGSRSSASYQDGAPVQQEAIQYPYCIVVNTGVDETERTINNYQVNNVYSYGMNKYYKDIMNNNSWLKSAGQWNDGTVYTGMYNWLVEQVNAGISGYVISTATYTDYDYVVNTTNQTFRLPLLNGDEVIPDWENSQNIASSLPFTSPRNGYIYGDGDGLSSLYLLNGVKVGVARGTSAWRSNGTVSVFVKRGDVFNSTADFTSNKNFGLSFIPAVGNGNLYYYVGDTVQNAQLINVARIEEKLTNVNAASRGYVVDSYYNNSVWYRIYSDGWCEQGFPDNTIQEHIVTLPVPMANNTYTVSIGQSGSSASSKVGRSTWKEKTATTLKLSADTLTDWIIAGYKA